MRTTIDLPKDLYRLTPVVARDSSRSLSAVVGDRMRRGLAEALAVPLARGERTGFAVLRVGRPVPSEDVRALDEEEPSGGATPRLDRTASELRGLPTREAPAAAARAPAPGP